MRANFEFQHKIKCILHVNGITFVYWNLEVSAKLFSLSFLRTFLVAWSSWTLLFNKARNRICLQGISAPQSLLQILHPSFLEYQKYNKHTKKGGEIWRPNLSFQTLSTYSTFFGVHFIPLLVLRLIKLLSCLVLPGLLFLTARPLLSNRTLSGLTKTPRLAPHVK